MGRALIPNAEERDCSVTGWSAVMLSWTGEDEANRTLEAYNGDPNRCDVARFAERFEVIGGLNTNAVLGQTTALLVGGPFSGADMTTTAYYDPPEWGCHIVISPPSNPELRRTGSARR